MVPTPVAMLTANASREHRGLAQDAGADHHVAKPITPDSLIAGIAPTLSADAGSRLRNGAEG